MQVLLAAGARVVARDEDGYTPLMFAATYNENPEVVQALLDAGADLEVRDVDGWAMLIFAALDNENPEVVRANHVTVTPNRQWVRDGWRL